MKVRKPKKTIKWQYLGETDPAQYIHSHRYHRSVSEAFKDADYATPIWRCENEWDKAKDMLIAVGVFVVFIGVFYLFAKGFILWLG